ncbi:MAG: hypothetical protein LBR85_08250 [Oscillospiraceae bacterium]|nr:hypothetical protein [Oscillospiraceae bacterium]
MSLKRRPQSIPLLMLVVCCCIYTFSLSAHSDASLQVPNSFVAICVFGVTLTSFLTIFSFINMYSKKNRNRKWIMAAVMYVLLLAQLGLDIVYYRIMVYETVIKPNPVDVTRYVQVGKSMGNTMVHIIALGITLLVILLIPVYHKLILKIDTSFEDEESVEYTSEETIEMED